MPVCESCGQIVKPEVVLYGESLDQDVMHRAIAWIEQADVLIIGGTSLVVYPAAGLIQYFHGSHLVLINRSQTSMDDQADIVIHDSIGKVMSSVISAM